MKRLIVFCLATLAISADARAQQYDVAGQLALLNRKTPQFAEWDRWYAAAKADVTVGRYWTPNFKTELELGTATGANIDGHEPVVVPGSSFPFQRYREHRLRDTTTVGATAVYQFFDNQWVHPFVGAGIELAREHHVAAALPEETVRFSTTVPTLRLPAVPAIDAVTYSVRPLVSAGFKFYVSPRAFVRTEARTSFTADGPVALQWFGGIGFDF